MLQLLQKKKIQLKITPSNALCTNCKNIADSCGVHAALLCDENVRRWRQQDPVACPWHTKHCGAVMLISQMKKKASLVVPNKSTNIAYRIVRILYVALRILV